MMNIIRFLLISLSVSLFSSLSWSMEQDHDAESQSKKQKVDHQQPIGQFNEAPLNGQLFMIHDLINRLSNRMNQDFEALENRLETLRKDVDLLNNPQQMQNQRPTATPDYVVNPATSSQRQELQNNIRSLFKKPVIQHQSHRTIDNLTPDKNEAIANSLRKNQEFINQIDQQLTQQQQTPLTIATNHLITAMQRAAQATAPTVRRAPRNPFIYGVRSSIELILNETSDKRTQISIYNLATGALINSFTLAEKDCLTCQYDANTDNLIVVHKYGISVYRNAGTPNKVIYEAIKTVVTQSSEVILDASIDYQDEKKIYIAFVHSTGAVSVEKLSILPGKSELVPLTNKTISSADFKECVPICVSLSKKGLYVAGLEKTKYSFQGFRKIYSLEFQNNIKELSHEKLSKVPDSIGIDDNKQVRFFFNNVILGKDTTYALQQKHLHSIRQHNNYNYTISITEDDYLNMHVYSKDNSKVLGILQKRPQCKNCKNLFVIDDIVVIVRNESNNGIIELYKLPIPDISTPESLKEIVPFHQEIIPNTTLEWAFPLQGARRLAYITNGGKSVVYELKDKSDN